MPPEKPPTAISTCISPIRAAANGVVVYAGNAVEGFGNLVLLKHDGGWVTAYAHAEDLLVIRGDTVRQGEKLGLVLERLSARLGPQRVLRPVLCEDHRPEWMCRWQNAALPLPRQEAPGTELPQPGFLLPLPLRLLVQDDHPVYHGRLMLLLGPQRVEGGGWARVEDTGLVRNVARDYWVALSAEAGVLWVFQTRLDGAPAWYLHGHFA